MRGMFDDYNPDIILYMSSHPFQDLNRYFESEEFKVNYGLRGEIVGHEIYVRMDSTLWDMNFEAI